MLRHGCLDCCCCPCQCHDTALTQGQGTRSSSALPSPGTVFANEIAQTFVNQRHNSVTSAQALAAPWGNRAAFSSNSGNYGSPQPPGSVGSPQPHGHGVVGSRGSSFTYAASSYSPQHFQHGAFGGWQQQQQQLIDSQQQLIDSQQLLLLQQQHEAAAAAAAATTAAAAHEQQQQMLVASTADAAGLPGSSSMGCIGYGDMLGFEPSLNGGAIEALAAGAGFGTIEGAAALMSSGAEGNATDPSGINVEFSLGMSTRAAAAAAAADYTAVGAVPALQRGGARSVSPDAAALAASQVHRNTWASFEAHRMQQLAEQQQQLQIQQQMQQEALIRSSGSFSAAAAAELAAREQAFAAAAAAASRRYEQDARVQSPVPESYWTAPVDSQLVLQQLANKPDAAAVAVRAAAASGTPFTVPGDANLPAPQQVNLHLSAQEQAAAAALLAARAGGAAGANLEVVGPLRPPELLQPWLSSWDVQKGGAQAAYLPQQYASLVQQQHQMRDEEELSAYGGIWTKQLSQQHTQHEGDAAVQQQQQHSEGICVASKPQLQHSSESSAAVSPRSPPRAEHMGAAAEMQLQAQAQMLSQQLTQRSHDMLQDLRQLAPLLQPLAMQSLPAPSQQQQQQQMAVDSRIQSLSMGRLSPLGDLARSCSGSIKPASPAAAAAVGAAGNSALEDVQHPAYEQQQVTVAARAAAALRGELQQLPADQQQPTMRDMSAPGCSDGASASSGTCQQSPQSPRISGGDGPAVTPRNGGRCKAGHALDGIPEQQGLEGRSSDAADGSSDPAQ
jgi:hypothetical protein